MSEPERFLLDDSFAGSYCRLIETYRLEPTVLAEQFCRIMRRIDAGESAKASGKMSKRKKGEKL